MLPKLPRPQRRLEIAASTDIENKVKFFIFENSCFPSLGSVSHSIATNNINEKVVNACVPHLRLAGCASEWPVTMKDSIVE